MMPRVVFDTNIYISAFAIPGGKKEIEAIKATAKKTLVKDRRITIRLYDHDYQGIQKKAIEMGIPYQTLISGIIHRYIEGDLTPKTG
jgi:hypothetical protein